MKDTILYIAYGSNLNLPQMQRRCPTANTIGNAALEGYQLLFRGGDNNAVATVEKKKGYSVPVLVWEITPTDEDSLDRYEGYPFLYRKETVKVRFDGKLVAAMVYIMNDGRALGSPSQYYYDVIKRGYKTAGFDSNFLKQAVRDSVME